MDDQITAHEQPLAAFVETLRSALPGTAVDAREAAEAVAHLSIRVAHVREAFAAGMLDILDAAGEMLLAPQALPGLLKLGEGAPSRMVRDLLKEAWMESRAELQRKGISRDGFDRLTLRELRANAATLWANATPFVAPFMQAVRSRAVEATRKGHVEALARSLVPAPRATALARLTWKVEAGPDAGCILPDCVALALLDDGDILPLAFADEDHIGAVVLPLAHDRLLVGTRERARHLGGELPDRQMRALLHQLALQDGEFRVPVALGFPWDTRREPRAGHARREFEHPSVEGAEALNARLMPGRDEAADACCDAWRWLVQQPERITGIASRDWAQVT